MRYKAQPVHSLPNGTKFEIVGLESLFRNLKVKFVSDCGTTITGEKKEKTKISESWSVLGLNYVISNKTQVRSL